MGNWSLWTILSLIISIGALAVAWYFYGWVKNLPTANKRMDEVAALIRNGAFTFLKKEYLIL
ncbi:MAG: hypothetical protein GX558_07945, partial [Clostridiales bacterium]|nr:hypothetical protein [Clostridiales bacterium]